MFTTHRDRKHPLQKDCIFATLRFNFQFCCCPLFFPLPKHISISDIFFNFQTDLLHVSVVLLPYRSCFFKESSSKTFISSTNYLWQGSSTWDDRHSDNLFSPFFHQRTGILMGRIKSGELQLWFTENCFLANCLNLTMQ